VNESIYAQIERIGQSSVRLTAAIARSDSRKAEILAAAATQWSEQSHPRDKGGRFSGGNSRPQLTDGSSPATIKQTGMGKKAKAAAAAVAIGVGAKVAYENNESIQTGLAQLGNRADTAKIAGVAAAIDGVKGMNAKVKGAMAGLSKKLGLDAGKDTGKSGGEQLLESVAKMGSTLKAGSAKAIQLTAARAATAVAAAQNETVRSVFIAKLKQAKNGQEMVNTIHGAAAAIDTVAHGVVVAAHVKVGADKAKKAVGEHAADVEKGTAAAVGIGLAVMASKKFGIAGARGVKPSAQGMLAPGKSRLALPPGGKRPTLPPSKPRLALPPGVNSKPSAKPKVKGISSATKAGLATVAGFGALAAYEGSRVGAGGQGSKASN
jgi:hypothetical protein